MATLCLLASSLFLLPRTKRQLQRLPLSPLPVPSFPTPHSAFPSLGSGPPGPVIIRKGGRRGAILAHWGFRGSQGFVLGTRGCQGVCVFLLFQSWCLPTRADPVLKSRRIQGQEHMALHIDMCIEKCVCIKMCYNCGCECMMCHAIGEPCSKGCFYPETLIYVNFGSSDSLGNPYGPSPFSALSLLPQILPSRLIIKAAVDRGDAQGHSKSLLPSPMTKCWPEPSTSGAVSHTQGLGCRLFQLPLDQCLTLGLAFSWGC